MNYTKEDALNGLCTPFEIGKPIEQSAKWSYQDYERGACLLEEVSTTKPQDEGQSTSPEGLIQELDLPTMAALKQACLRSIHKHGNFDKFLKDNPGFTMKMLLAMVKEAGPPMKQELVVNISWLSPERLAYKQVDSALGVEHTPEIVDVVPSPLPEPGSTPPPSIGTTRSLNLPCLSVEDVQDRSWKEAKPAPPHVEPVVDLPYHMVIKT